MKDSYKYFSTPFFLLLVILIVSCSKVNPAYNRENIKATWISQSYDGNEYADDKKFVYTFDENGGLKMETILNIGNGDYKWGSNSVIYDVYCCGLNLSGDVTGMFDIVSQVNINQQYDITNSSDSLITLKKVIYQINKNDVATDFNLLTMRKLSKKFAAPDSILGMWKFQTKDLETFDKYAIEFKTNSLFNFYEIKDDGSLQLYSDADNYKLYGGFLFINLFNNLPFGKENHWSVLCIKELLSSPFNGTMTFTCNGHNYTLIKNKNQS